MSLFGKVEADVEIKAPATKLHEIYSCRPYQLSNASPDKVQSVDLLEGEWGKEGSVIYWNFFLEGKATRCKEIIEAIDYQSKSTSFKVIEGQILEQYKSFKFILQVTPKGEGSLVHWTLEYEKLKENVPDPNTLLVGAFDLTKDVDAYLALQA